MGQWEEFCTLCGGRTWIDDTMAIKFGKWLHAIVGIAPGRDHVVPLVAYTGYGSFFVICHCARQVVKVLL